MSHRIVDCHMHILHGQPQRLAEVADAYGFDRFNVLSCPCYVDEANNLEVLLAKALSPGRAYAFGGLTHSGAPDAAGYARQVRAMIDAGLDGLKCIETKPNKMRELDRPLDSPLFDEVFAIAEQARWPILWHVGDPASFWSLETAPRFAIEGGLCYFEPGFSSLEALYDQAENVLRRHPGLQVCFAHFYFTSDDLPHARRMLDTWPGVRFDLTPGSEMFGNFARNPEAWRAFFIAYQDRILFGTDFTDDPAELGGEIYDHLLRLVHGTLLEEGPFTVWDIACHGLHLPDAALKNIYAENFERLAGTSPRPLCAEGVAQVYAIAASALATPGGDNALLARCQALRDEIFEKR